MDIEKQVCTLEQAQKLKEIGVEQNSIFTWVDLHNDTKALYFTENLRARGWFPDYAAFTVAELFTMMPYVFKFEESNRFVSSTKYEPDAVDKVIKYICGIHTVASEGPVIAKKYFPTETMAEGLAKMLIYLIEKGITTVEEINERLSL